MIEAAGLPSSVIRQDLVPVAVGYLLLMGALAAGLRIMRRTGRSEVPRTGEQPPRRSLFGLIRHLLATAVDGYLVLMAVIIAYAVAIGPSSGKFIESAFTGCAMLLGLSCPVFIAASWLTERRHRHRAVPEPDEADT